MAFSKSSMSAHKQHLKMLPKNPNVRKLTGVFGNGGEGHYLACGRVGDTAPTPKFAGM